MKFASRARMIKESVVQLVALLPSPPYCTLAFGVWGIVACFVCLLLMINPSDDRSGTGKNESSVYHLSEGCRLGCHAAFGTILGVHNGVFAYSNCNSMTCISGEWNAIAGQAQQKTGIKWQCVEYARRYWMLSEKPASFGDVEGASDIWSLETVQLQDGSTAPLQKFPNGQPSQSGGSAPLAGDLLIYPKQGGGFPFGHVAVIVRVGANSVFVAEQNWGNKLWPGPHHEYAREIPMQHDAQSGAYTINEVDGDIVTGWVRYTA